MKYNTLHLESTTRRSCMYLSNAVFDSISEQNYSEGKEFMLTTKTMPGVWFIFSDFHDDSSYIDNFWHMNWNPQDTRPKIGKIDSMKFVGLFEYGWLEL